MDSNHHLLNIIERMDYKLVLELSIANIKIKLSQLSYPRNFWPMIYDLWFK